MKIRLGFVSNSSSACYVIPKKILSEEQISQIENHIEYSKEHFPQIPWAEKGQEWDIVETDEDITASTVMNNFDIYDFFIAIGIKEEDITYEVY